MKLVMGGDWLLSAVKLECGILGGERCLSLDVGLIESTSGDRHLSLRSILHPNFTAERSQSPHIYPNY